MVVLKNSISVARFASSKSMYQDLGRPSAPSLQRYAWRHGNSSAVLDVWCHVDAIDRNERDIEAVEAEVVYRIRAGPMASISDGNSFLSIFAAPSRGCCRHHEPLPALVDQWPTNSTTADPRFQCPLSGRTAREHIADMPHRMEGLPADAPPRRGILREIQMKKPAANPTERRCPACNGAGYPEVMQPARPGRRIAKSRTTKQAPRNDGIGFELLPRSELQALSMTPIGT
jgi:hypothetical protein